jgi:hypothetical protein
MVAAHEEIHEEVDARGIDGGHEHAGEVGGLVGEGGHPPFPVCHGATSLVHIVIKYGAL